MKQKRQLAVLGALVLIAVVIWASYFRNERPVVTADNTPVTQSIRLLSVENPQLHWSALDKARKTEYKGTGRNPFSAIPAAPPVPPHSIRKPDPVVVPQPVVDVPPPPPTLPPNMKFFGYGTIPNSNSRRAFFSNGEDIYVVTEGEVLLNQYRILKINNSSLEFEEVSTGRRGTAPLVEQTAGPA